MTTALSTVVFRGTRRVRLFFNGSLAAGAFTATSFYGVECEDGATSGPINVVAVFAVVDTPASVELAVDEDIAPGSLYTTTCTTVPCLDGSFYTGAVPARVGQPLATPPNIEPTTNDVDLLLYDRDLVHDGNDFVEDATGDLATLSGRENYRGALGRRMASDGLPWDDSYGAKPNEYIDAPETQSVPFSGNLLAQARADDRTRQASIDVVQDPVNPGDWAFEMTVVGRDNLNVLTLTVLAPTQ